MRAPLMLLAMSLAAPLGGGCAGSASKTGGGSGGQVGTGSGGATGSGGMVNGCAVTIEAVSSYTLVAPPFGPGQKLRVTAVGGGATSGRVFVWSVTYADGTPVAYAHPQTGSSALIELPVEKPGSYTLDVRVAESFPVCAGRKVVTTAAPPGAPRATYQARLIPPPGYLYPPQTQTIQIVHGMPVADNVFMLGKGLAVALYPVDEQAAALAAYVRLTRKDTGDTFEAHTAAGKASLVIPASATFDVLVVPDGELPPALFLDQNGDLLDGKSLVVTAGVEVTGTLTLAGGPARGGATVSGARVVLRSESAPGQLPSTTAISDSTGGFTLRARPGTWALAIDPAPTSALPSVLLPQSAGLNVAGDRTIGFDWAMPAIKAAVGKVQSSSGAGVAGARVVIESAAGSLPGAGTLTFPGGTRQLEGRKRTEVFSGSDGSVTLPNLPAGIYRATAIPAGETSPDAVTVAAPLDLSTGSPFTVKLLPKVNLSGRVAAPAGLSPGEAGGARVLALDTEGGLLYPAFSGEVDATNQFSMLVNPARRYSLLVLPTSGKLAGRAVLGTYLVETPGLVVTDSTLPAGVLYSGIVRGVADQAVPGTTIRLVATATQQLVAEATSREDGSFTLAVPDVP